MKSWFRFASCIVLHLGLLNFVFPVVSSCSIVGPNVFQVGDHLSLKCVDTDADVQQTAFILDFTTDSRADKRSITDGSSIFTIDGVTLDDTRKYRCNCSTTNLMHLTTDHYVLVVEANMYALTSNVSCHVAVMLMVTSTDHRYNLTSFSCPTLDRGNPNIWKFSSAKNSHGERVKHIFAVGESGGASQTCNFTVWYHPNGANFTENFSKTVEGTSCIKRIDPLATRHIGLGSDGPITSKSGRGASRDAQHTLLLTALILLCHSAKCRFNCQ